MANIPSIQVAKTLTQKYVLTMHFCKIFFPVVKSSWHYVVLLWCLGIYICQKYHIFYGAYKDWCYFDALFWIVCKFHEVPLLLGLYV